MGQRNRDRERRAHPPGHYVFPVTPGSKVPAVGKWRQRSTTDPVQVTAWWTRNPAYNLGIDCGKSGLVVIDLDRPKDGNPDAEWGGPQLQVLAEQHGDRTALDTFTVQTPRGGRHLYYQADGHQVGNSQGKIGPLVDVRGRGGFVLAPGSTVGEGMRIIQNSTVKITNGPLTCADAGRRGADKGVLNNPLRAGFRLVSILSASLRSLADRREGAGCAGGAGCRGAAVSGCAGSAGRGHAGGGGCAPVWGGAADGA